MASHDSPQDDSRTEAAVPPSAKKLTVKQEREQRRLEKVEKFKQEQARAKRNRIIAISASSVLAVAVVAVIIAIVVSSATPPRDPDTIEIEGLQSWSDIDYTHVEDGTVVDYEGEYGMNPPAGGSHYNAWLNCGVYEQPQENERATHSLEHGAVWVTYDADELSEAELDTLRSSLPSTYIVLSPYEGLEAPVVASAWGEQVTLDGVDDPRLQDFIDKFWQSGSAPELGASCTGAVDGPGKIA